MMNEEMSDEEFYEELKKSLTDTIEEMKVQMGRFPTEDEVISFVWGTDAEREDILKKGSVHGG